jgi:DNA-binding NarL/FixJ family response regulator
LLVDDSHPFRQILERLFRPFPSLTLIGEAAAADGLSAVQMALSLRPDIILMDVQMPGLDGIEATRHIKATLPRVYVIGLSVSDHPIISQAMLAAGASAFVPKFCALTLPQVIEHLTGRRLDDREGG